MGLTHLRLQFTGDDCRSASRKDIPRVETLRASEVPTLSHATQHHRHPARRLLWARCHAFLQAWLQTIIRGCSCSPLHGRWHICACGQALHSQRMPFQRLPKPAHLPAYQRPVLRYGGARHVGTAAGVQSHVSTRLQALEFHGGGRHQPEGTTLLSAPRLSSALR